MGIHHIKDHFADPFAKSHSSQVRTGICPLWQLGSVQCTPGIHERVPFGR